MSATVDCPDRMAELEKAIEKVRVQARALQIVVMGDKSWHQSGYWWALRDAEKEAGARRRAEEERHISAADLSAKSILKATREAAAARDGAVQARDVALVLLPEAAPTDAPGRQLLIARCGKRMLELVGQGKLVRVSAPDGRKTSRYAIAGGATNAS